MKKLASVLFAALLLLGVQRDLWAHGGGVLKADRSSTAAGSSIQLMGSEFEVGATYQLRLKGALQEFPLGSAKVDAQGRFAMTVSIPSEAREGSYRLEAVAPDGDVGASLEVTVLGSAPVPGPASTEPAGHMENMPAGMGPMPTAAETPIIRQQSAAGATIIGLVIGLAAGLGVGLLLRRRVAYEEA
jgi:hypothetical protein